MMTSMILKTALAGAVATLGMAGTASAQPARFDPSLGTGGTPAFTQVQMRGGPGVIRPPGGGRGAFRGGGYRGGGPRYGGGYGGGHGYHRGGNGFAVGAGVAGLAAGALIGGAIASQAAPGYGYGYDGGYAPPPPQVVDPGYAYSGSGYAEADEAPVQGGGDSQAYCMQRYKSYDPGSGTYLGYDGARHPCP